MKTLEMEKESTFHIKSSLTTSCSVYNIHLRVIAYYPGPSDANNLKYILNLPTSRLLSEQKLILDTKRRFF